MYDNMAVGGYSNVRTKSNDPEVKAAVLHEQKRNVFAFTPSNMRDLKKKAPYLTALCKMIDKEVTSAGFPAMVPANERVVMYQVFPPLPAPRSPLPAPRSPLAIASKT